MPGISSKALVAYPGGLRANLACIVHDDDDHGAAADFAIVIELRGQFLWRWRGDLEFLKAGRTGDGYKTELHQVFPFRRNDGTIIPLGTGFKRWQLSRIEQRLPGTYVFSPAAETVLSVGKHLLKMPFAPTDRADYLLATATQMATVTSASN